MNSGYLFKVWLSTIVVTPLLFIFLTIIIQGFSMDPEITFFYIFSFLYGFMFSIPTLLVLLLSSFLLENRIKSVVKLKACLLFIGLICMAATIQILFGGDSYDLNGDFGGLTFTLLYGVCMFAFTIIFKLKKPVDSSYISGSQ